mmetsp:Transcript_102566/g.295342  ORF Transcript_102566/g.295342 Transcript_102566/m.295342 type:complete len:253 (+) Transcript_102566:450-1208(+)
MSGPPLPWPHRAPRWRRPKRSGSSSNSSRLRISSSSSNSSSCETASSSRRPWLHSRRRPCSITNRCSLLQRRRRRSGRSNCRHRPTGRRLRRRSRRRRRKQRPCRLWLLQAIPRSRRECRRCSNISKRHSRLRPPTDKRQPLSRSSSSSSWRSITRGSRRPTRGCSSSRSNSGNSSKGSSSRRSKRPGRLRRCSSSRLPPLPHRDTPPTARSTLALRTAGSTSTRKATCRARSVWRRCRRGIPWVISGQSCP